MAAYAIVCCPKSSFSVSRESEAVEPNTDMVLNTADFPAGRKVRLRLALQGRNGYWYQIRMWDRFAAAAIGNAFTINGTSFYEIEESPAFTMAEGLKSVQLRIWVDDDTKPLYVQKISLQVESA